jgi:hypothetical protein
LLQCEQVKSIEQLIGSPIKIALITKEFADFLG